MNRLRVRTALLLAHMVGLSAACHPRQVEMHSDASIKPEAGPAAATPPSSPPEIFLFYSSDVRGRVGPTDQTAGALGGLARRATLVDRAKIEAAAVVQVDSGDLLPPAGDDATLDAQD